MLTYADVQQAAQELGFETIGEVNPKQLAFRAEVRDMCEVNRCGKYATSWACPPGCGALESMTERAKSYQFGIVVQTWGELEDDFDMEGIDRLSALQKERFKKFADYLRAHTVHPMPMGSGTCDLCEKCTYPDSPCRFPELVNPSMESCGLLVTQVCEQADIPYYHGRQTLAFTSCALFNL